jgi:hypothetical protein
MQHKMNCVVIEQEETLEAIVVHGSSSSTREKRSSLSDEKN